MRSQTDSFPSRPCGKVSASAYTCPKPHGYFSCSRPELIALVPSNALRILDIGCGQGEFARGLRESRPASTLEIIGVEVSESAAETAANVVDELILGNVEQVALGYQDYFDCIVFGDVLEHLIDPWSMLRRAEGLLRTTGTVIASIPNVQHWRVIIDLMLGRWEYSEFGIMDSTHLRFFTRKSIYNLFAAGGFVVRQIFPLLVTKKAKIAHRVTGGLADPFLTRQYVVLAESARNRGA
jgi:O-antigen biosynthesis protein